MKKIKRVFGKNYLFFSLFILGCATATSIFGGDFDASSSNDKIELGVTARGEFLSPFGLPQSIPTIVEVTNFIKNNCFLITYREGEAVYGTYFFIEIHYCSSGLYGLYGKSVKQTVLGNEQRNNWQEYGNWKVIEYNGIVGVQYKTTTALEKFVPVYRLPNGSLSIGEGVSIVKQGKAICN